MVARSVRGFVLFLLSSLLYAIAGVFTLRNPDLAAATLTLLLGLALIASGVMRIWWGIALRKLPAWGWAVASGVITLGAGAIFVLGWPTDSVWLLGLLLAMDLTFQGIAAMGFGFTLRKILE